MSSLQTEIFNALGDPTRRKIYESLALGGEQNVASLTAAANVSQPMVSRHLSILRNAGLVADRKQGRENFFRVRPAGIRPLFDWMREQSIFWDERLNALDDLLSRMDN